MYIRTWWIASWSTCRREKSLGETENKRDLEARHLKKIYFILKLNAHVCEHVSASAHGGQKRVLDPLVLAGSCEQSAMGARN